MPTFTIQDPSTGDTIHLTGDAPPSGDTIRKAFALKAKASSSLGVGNLAPQTAKTNLPPAVGIDNQYAPKAMLSAPPSGLGGILPTIQRFLHGIEVEKQRQAFEGTGQPTTLGFVGEAVAKGMSASPVQYIPETESNILNAAKVVGEQANLGNALLFMAPFSAASTLAKASQIPHALEAVHAVGRGLGLGLGAKIGGEAVGTVAGTPTLAPGQAGTIAGQLGMAVGLPALAETAIALQKTPMQGPALKATPEWIARYNQEQAAQRAQVAAEAQQRKVEAERLAAQEAAPSPFEKGKVFPTKPAGVQGTTSTQRAPVEVSGVSSTSEPLALDPMAKDEIVPAINYRTPTSSGTMLGDATVDTHNDLLARLRKAKGAVNENDVQRGFWYKGKFLTREQAAQLTGLPTTEEAGALHSQDLHQYHRSKLQPPPEVKAQPVLPVVELPKEENVRENVPPQPAQTVAGEPKEVKAITAQPAQGTVQGEVSGNVGQRLPESRGSVEQSVAGRVEAPASTAVVKSARPVGKVGDEGRVMIERRKTAELIKDLGITLTKPLNKLTTEQLYNLWDAVKTKHRQTMVEHHPDRGGDAAVVAKVNAIRDELKTRFQKLGIVERDVEKEGLAAEVKSQKRLSETIGVAPKPEPMAKAPKMSLEQFEAKMRAKYPAGFMDRMTEGEEILHRRLRQQEGARQQKPVEKPEVVSTEEAPKVDLRDAMRKFNAGEDLTDVEEAAVEAEFKRRKGQEGFVMLPPNVWERMRFQGGSKIDPQQMLNRLKNTLGEASETFRWLEAAGLQKYLSQPRTADEVRKWAEENSPKAEVHTYGMEGKVSEAKKERDKLHGELDMLPREQRNQLDTAYDEYLRNPKLGKDYINPAKYGVTKEAWEKKVRIGELDRQIENEPRDTSPRATQYYSTVSALPTDQPMPEWTASAREANNTVILPNDNTGLNNIARKHLNLPEDAASSISGAYHTLAANVETPPETGVLIRLLDTKKVRAASYQDLQRAISKATDNAVQRPEQITAANLKRPIEVAGGGQEYELPIHARVTEAVWDKSVPKGEIGVWSQLHDAPKNVQRVDVVIPHKQAEGGVWATTELDNGNWVMLHNDKPVTKEGTKAQVEQWAKEYKEANKVKWQPDNLHENLPNTLGWAMIQYKTGPKGEKIAVIAEAQSRWGQERRELLSGRRVIKKDGVWKVQTKREDNSWYDATSHDFSSEKEAHEYMAQLNNARLTHAPDHPLLRDYNRLILKAAIEQARKEGATHIMVSDAETAMMTEGHDLQADINAAEQQGINWGMGQDIPRGSEENIPQAKGMRANYGPTFINAEGKEVQSFLPRIAEELTGQKGERVSLGEHKNAFTDEPHPMLDPEDIPREEFNQAGDKVRRSNLIFRNPDGTPKTDVSGMLYDITKTKPEEFSYFGKDKLQPPKGSLEEVGLSTKRKGEAGFVINPRGTDLLDTLSEKVRQGKDFVSSFLENPHLTSGALGFKGYSFPRTESKSPLLANKMAEYANSFTAASLQAKDNINKVFGDKATDKQFLQQVGAVIYEDMRQGSKEIGNPVWQIANSPFKTEAQYDAALNNPEIRSALERWKEIVQKPATEAHVKLGGKLAPSGRETGAFANLQALLTDQEGNLLQEFGDAASPARGPLGTLKRGTAFGQERKFSGKAYNFDAAELAQRMTMRNWARAKQLELVETLEQTGLGKVLEHGDPVPAGMERTSQPVALRTIVSEAADGSKETITQNKYLAVSPYIKPELYQAMQLDRSAGEVMRGLHPVLDTAVRSIITTQTALGIDLGVHMANDFFAVLMSNKGIATDPVSRVFTSARDLLKARTDVVRESPEVVEELLRMAKAGVTFRAPREGWSAEQLRVVDTATRLVLNREYEALVKEGKVTDTPAERRRYISGRAGEYNRRFMTWFQQSMQESGLGAFNVAGRNFNRLAAKNLLMSPGVKASSMDEALRMRLSLAVGIATTALVLPAVVNQMQTGSPDAGGQLKPWEMYLYKDKEGKIVTMDMSKPTLLMRGMRATGTKALVEQQVIPRLKGEQPAAWGQTIKEGAQEALKTAAQPFVGPPLNVASTLATGKTPLGYEQRAPGEKGWPYVGAATAALNPLVGPATGMGAEGAKQESTVERVGKKIGSLVGMKEASTPRKIITDLRRQFLYKIGKSKDAEFAPTEYKPLIMTLEAGDKEGAKVEYTKLMESLKQTHASSENPEQKAKDVLEKYFNHYKNAHGQTTKEDEDKFYKQLTPHQRDLYAKMLETQKEVSDRFFAELQAKQPKQKGFKGFGGFKSFGGF